MSWSSSTKMTGSFTESLKPTFFYPASPGDLRMATSAVGHEFAVRRLLNSRPLTGCNRVNHASIGDLFFRGFTASHLYRMGAPPELGIMVNTAM